MRTTLEKLFKGKKILILGFGREGKSTLNLLRRWFTDLRIAVADQDENISPSVKEGYSGIQFFTGKHYLDSIDWADIVIKSPGIKMDELAPLVSPEKITSQSDLFLAHFKHQTIGITGTKGKSTTTSLIFHCLQLAGKKAVIAGNIGIPPFDVIDQIHPDTFVVFELSAHQLESVTNSPHIAIMTNLFPEHLDHFNTFDRYASAKLNIAKFQNADDYLIWDAENQNLINLLYNLRSKATSYPVKFLQSNADDEYRRFFLWNGEVIDLGNSMLQGMHNMKNMLLASNACMLAGLTVEEIQAGIASFLPLHHRMEILGVVNGIRFINDSISTIPEATIEAVKTFPDTNTLILGGFDRGLNYHHLIEFLVNSNVQNFIFTGKAGKRMMELFANYPGHQKQLFFSERFHDMGPIISRITRQGTTCLLSPAASSYDQFENFEERGKAFLQIMNQIGRL